MRDTIFALTTAPGRAAVAIVRVSGPDAERMLKTFCSDIPRPRHAALKRVRDSHGEIIDEGLVLWFPQPASFTGEDVFELQLHGGAAVLTAVMGALSAMGARTADPGEFTRRAFESGRLELSQAEAIADLVDAETQAQRRQAVSQLGGDLARRGAAWRETLLSALAFLGAQIDFPDEDLPPDVAQRALSPLAALLADIEAVLRDVRGERIREGLKIALIGAPNAGKSSLLNALLGRDAAIVTAVPGATRDVIEAPLFIAGYKVLLADMAGIRDAVDEVEIEGVRRARAWAEAAALRLWLVEPGGQWRQSAELVQAGDVLVLSKSDGGEAVDEEAAALATALGLEILRANVLSSDGLAGLRTHLQNWVVEAMSGTSHPSITRARHRAFLERSRDHLKAALSRDLVGFELVSENVRLAARALEQLSGRMDPDAVLDKVFGSFCIGK